MAALFYFGDSMSYYVYILQSDLTGKMYTGQTSDLEKRIKKHNSDYGRDITDVTPILLTAIFCDLSSHP